MIRPRVTVARLLVVVLIAGLDCGLIRLFLSTDQGAEGLLAFGLAISAGVVGWLLGRGRLRRFSAGFTLTGLAAAVAFVAWMLAVPGAGEWYMSTYLNAAIRRLPGSTYLLVPVAVPNAERGVDLVPGVALLLCIDALICLPVLIAALAGGLLTLVFRRRASSKPRSEPVPA